MSFSATRELYHGVIVHNIMYIHILLYSQGFYLRLNETKCNLLWSHIVNWRFSHAHCGCEQYCEFCPLVGLCKMIWRAITETLPPYYPAP